MTVDVTARVRAFLDCWHRLDLDGALGFLAEDAVFAPDIKSEPTRGRDAIAQLWDKYMARIESYDADIRTMLADDRTVVVERIEKLGVGRRTLVLPIMGLFEFDDQGRMTAWRDYWDTSMAAAG